MSAKPKTKSDSTVLESTLAEWTGRDMAALNAVAFKVGTLARFASIDPIGAW